MINSNKKENNIRIQGVDGQKYFPNELENRNLVALPNRVWVTDLFKAKTILETGKTLKILLVVDLGTGELLLLKSFSTYSGGNVKSRLVTQEFDKLITRRKIQNQLLIHSDRGSEFTSLEYRRLFEKRPFLVGSMSLPHSPTDNPVAERFVRTIKNQIPQAGEWPSYFKNTIEANKFLEKRRAFLNEVHIGKRGEGLTSTQLFHALQTKVDQAPQVVLHWPPLKGVTDKQTQDITLFKQNSVEEWSRKGWSPMAALKRTEISSAIAARGIQYVGEDLKEVGDQLKERLDALHESVDLLSKKLLEKKKGRKKRLELPLRDRASGSVLDYLLKLKRPENFSYYCWSRNRVAIVLLRWLGARASDVKKLTLKEINQLKKDGTLQLSQVKTGKIRVIVIPKRAQEDLEKVKIDVERVFGEDNEKMLATPAHSYQEISNTQWLNSLNQFIKLATPNFNLILSSHSFRVNYVTSLLRSVPLEKVSKIVGHSDIRTTVRYDRYVIDKDQVKGVLEELG